jgi:eukaryotic-like serine/threonine-protein kinase
MNDAVPIDEELLQRLPLPIAQLWRRSQNAKTPLECHHAAFYLWEAALKLLGSVAVVEYVHLSMHDPGLVELLKNLARPSLGHWWEFVRRLVPVLAEHGDPGFTSVCDILLGPVRDDLPRAAGLDSKLIEVLGGRGGARSTVRLPELIDRLVQYRNREIGHGAAGQRPSEFYASMSRVLLAAAAEVLGRLDILAGRRLLSVGEVRRQATGHWIVERYSLTGESPKRIESLAIPESETARLPRPEQVYLETVAGSGRAGSPHELTALHPLVLFDASSGLVYFLNARRGKRGIEYLCYGSGDTVRREELRADHRELLARVLGQPVDEAAAAAWADVSLAEEPTEPRAPNEPTPRRSIGEFDLLSRLGQGGMGVVYRAWQPSLGRQVALKCMLRAGDPKADARFLREIRALGRVEHPNVVKVFTSGAENDQWFYAMELIEGAELSRVCDQLAGSSTAEIDDSQWRKALTVACDQVHSQENQLSDTEARPKRSTATVRAAPARDEIPVGARGHVTLVVEIIRQIAEATHTLHEAGVIHRDIKPGNIMLTGDANHPVLMDLGLAQLADETEGRLTRTRQFVGTVRYASPEQILAAGRVDRRTDVYSLGATLWELLTLRPIFSVDDDTATPDLMLKIQTTDPGTPRKFNKHVPRDLEAITLKCLEKDRARRYSTAAELADDLRRFVSGEPVSAQPPNLSYLLGKYIRRHKAPLVVAGLVLAVLVGSGVLELIQVRHAWRLSLAANEELARQLYHTRITVAERELAGNNDFSRASELLQNCREDLRGWEWRYLRRLLDGGRVPLLGHTAGLWGAEFSPDGTRIATASIDGTVKIWEADSGRLLKDIDSSAVAVPFGLGSILAALGVARIPATCVEFSPDGRQVAAGSFAPTYPLKNSTGIVIIWDVETGQMIRKFDGQLGVVLSLAYSPDGQRIASSSINPENTFVVWEARTGEIIKTVAGHTSQIHRLRYSPDGRLIASSDTDGAVHLWDADSLTEIRKIDAHRAPVVGLAFARDGLHFATGGEDGLVRVWETATGRQVRELLGNNGSALSVSFSQDGTLIASSGFDKTVRLWDAATGQEKITLRGHTDTVWSVSFSPDAESKRIVSASFDKTARIWDTTPISERTGAGLFTLAGHKDRVNGVAFSPDGRYLASSSWDDEIRLWDGMTGADWRTLKGHKGSVWAISFSPDGGRIASASWDHKVKIWSVKDGRDLLTFSEHTAPVHSVAFSPDGQRLVSSGFDGQVKVWEAETGNVIANCDGFIFPILAVAFSPDGRYVASGGADRAIKVWDAKTGSALLTLKGHEAAVHGLAYSPDGKRLASASWDHTLKVWDLVPNAIESSETKPSLTITGHKDRVLAVAFTADGQRIASASEDKTVRLWDPKTGQELMAPLHHRGQVWAVVFSPDGKRLASGCWSKDARVKTWRIE